MDITPKTKLSDLLKAYPELEEKVIKMAPPFKNLKNPILRKTVGKLASLSKVAQIGGLDIRDFVNELRKLSGQKPLEGIRESEKIQLPKTAPDWLKGEPLEVVDGVAMLEQGEHPLNYINSKMKEIESGQYIVLNTNFAPLPMHEAMMKQGYTVFHEVLENVDHRTFIGKP